MRRPTILVPFLLTASLAGGLVLAHNDRPSAEQPTIGARVKPVLTADGLRFKDANGNGQVDPYEDWRLDIDARVSNLASQMTRDEKAGMMLIDTLNPGFGGVVVSPADDYIRNQKMTRFIFRSVVTARPVETTGRGWQQHATWRSSRDSPGQWDRNGGPSDCARCTAIWRTWRPSHDGTESTSVSPRMWTWRPTSYEPLS